MSKSKRVFGIVVLATLVSTLGGWGGSILYNERKKYVQKKKRERRRAYRGSNSMRRGSGKRAGDAVDAWKNQFKK